MSFDEKMERFLKQSSERQQDLKSREAKNGGSSK
jgi:S1 RNA binding domain protein